MRRGELYRLPSGELVLVLVHGVRLRSGYPGEIMLTSRGVSVAPFYHGDWQLLTVFDGRE